MWRLKQFIPKDQIGIEGRIVDIGDLKLHIRSIIAEGGFSCVYLARDTTSQSKQYALKHVICSDEESLDLVKKEIAVMRALKGHPNVVTLHSEAIFDMGRTKEAFIAMEFCDKSLVGVLESKGVSYFEEKQILLIFRDVCNAVYALHCQSPPIAHRDLKPENILLGCDGTWKLCDFGSISTSHKCFDRLEEMGIEEDNIRKHTTPAYRAPEMWDLFRKEIINEKVDIWALGCLLYRLCYIKSAFDGESKLQILNGNYRIPELPKYNSSLTDLIRDMLQSSPDTRPDITQVWSRVNERLPIHLKRSSPDISSDVNGDKLGPTRLSFSVSRGMALPQFGERRRDMFSQSSFNPGFSEVLRDGTPLGAFWSTSHARASHDSQNREPRLVDSFQEHKQCENCQKENSYFLEGQKKHSLSTMASSFEPGRDVQEHDDGSTADLKPKLSYTEVQDSRLHITDVGRACSSKSAPQTSCISFFQNDDFGEDFTVANWRENALRTEVLKLKEQLKIANMEKEDIKSKYENLSAVCFSQRREIQNLKNSLTAKTLSSNVDNFKSQTVRGNSEISLEEDCANSLWEMRQMICSSSSSIPYPDLGKWQPFSAENSVVPTSSISVHQKGNGQSSTTSHVYASFNEGNSSSSGCTNQKQFSKPTGWAGF